MCVFSVSFHPHDFDVTISWPSQPPTDSTPVRASNFTSQNELYASHSYRLMLLEDMLSSCKLQLETSLRANATANSEIHITRERLQKLQDENKTSLDRAAHFESVSIDGFGRFHTRITSRNTRTCYI